MERTVSVLVVIGLLYSLPPEAVVAQAPAPVTIRLAATAERVPSDFSGLSFETGSLLFSNPNYKRRAYFWDPANTRLAMVLRNLGIKTIRIGGMSVDRGAIPSRKAIDTFFRFAKAADVRVIYSLRLANGSARQDAAIARYVWGRYRRYLICLAIGNEPELLHDVDPRITNFASYIAKWNRIAAAVVRAAPGVVLGGPDNCSGPSDWPWAQDFAKAEENNRNVRFILCHYEPGGGGRLGPPGSLSTKCCRPVVGTPGVIPAAAAVSVQWPA